MKFKSSLILLFLFVFSISTLAQANKLVGKWSLLTLKVDGQDRSIPVSKNSPKIRLITFFNNGGLGKNVTCNSAQGKYVTGKGGKFKYTPGLTTLMFCGDDEHQFSDLFETAFFKATKYRIKGQVLTFEDAAKANILTFTSVPKDN